MADTGRMVTSVKDDRNFRPWVVLRLSRFYNINLAERAFPLLLGDVCDIDHIHIFYLGRELLLASTARPGLVSIIIITRLALALVLGHNLSGLLDDPAVPVSMDGRLVGIVVDGAGLVQDLIQLCGAALSSLESLPLVTTALIAEAGINLAIIGVTAATSITALVVSVTPRFPVSVTHFGSAGIAITIALLSEPVILTSTKSSHELCEACHCSGLLMPELSGQPFVTDTMLE